MWKQYFSTDNPNALAGTERIAQPNFETDISAGGSIQFDLATNGECAKNTGVPTLPLSVQTTTDYGKNWNTVFTFPSYSTQTDSGYNDFSRVSFDIPGQGPNGGIRFGQFDPADSGILVKDRENWAFSHAALDCSPFAIADNSDFQVKTTVFSDDFSAPSTNWVLASEGMGTCGGLCFDADTAVTPDNAFSGAGWAYSKSSFDFTTYQPYLELDIQSQVSTNYLNDRDSEASRLVVEYSTVDPTTATRNDWVHLRDYSGYRAAGALYNSVTKVKFYLPSKARQSQVWIRLRHRHPGQINPFVGDMKLTKHQAGKCFAAGGTGAQCLYASPIEGQWSITGLNIFSFAPVAGTHGAVARLNANGASGNTFYGGISNPEYPLIGGYNGDLTVEAWVKMSADSSTIIARKNSTTTDWFFGFSNAAGIATGLYPFAEIQTTTGNTKVVSTSAITADTWTLVGFTWDHTSATVKVYVNGQDVSGTPSPNLASGTAVNSLNANIQLGNFDAADTFLGSIDNLAIFSVARSASQMKQDYQHFPDEKTVNLIGLYNFDTIPVGSCGKIADLSIPSFSSPVSNPLYLSSQWIKYIRTDNPPIKFSGVSEFVKIQLGAMSVDSSDPTDFEYTITELPSKGTLFIDDETNTKVKKGDKGPSTLRFVCNQYDKGQNGPCTATFKYSASLNGISSPNVATVNLETHPRDPVIDQTALFIGIGVTAGVLMSGLIAYRYVQHRRRLAADKFRALFKVPELSLDNSFTLPYFYAPDARKWMESHSDSIPIFDTLLFDKYYFIDALSTLFTSSSSTDCSRAIVYLAQHNKTAPELIKHFVFDEVARIPQGELLFRGSNVASKMWTAYTGLTFGLKYKNLCLAMPLYETCTEHADKKIELDSERTEDSVLINKYRLMASVQRVFESIKDNASNCPPQIREILAYVRKAVSKKFSEHALKAVGGFIFLRYFAPAIAVPEQNGLLADEPDENSRNTLLLVARVIQNLANDVEFGVKEAHMQSMNDFIISNRESMVEYLKVISTDSNSLPSADDDEDIDTTFNETDPEASEYDLPEHLREVSILVLYKFMYDNREALLTACKSISDSTAQTKIISNLTMLFESLGEPIDIPVYEDDDNLNFED